MLTVTGTATTRSGGTSRLAYPGVVAVRAQQRYDRMLHNDARFRVVRTPSAPF